MRTIKKEEKVVTDWHGVLKEINKIGVFGAKKVQSITIKPYESELHDKPQYTLIIDTLEERDDSIGRLADELLETIALEDEAYFQKHGFYTTRTRANAKSLSSKYPKNNEN